MKHQAAFLSTREDWSTPQAFFDHLHARYHFTLDAAASPENAKCADYFTEEDDALTKRWRGVVFCNPPYGPGIGKWVAKARYEAGKGATVVLLIPTRTDTSWWHDHVMKARHIVLIRGRMRFGGSPVNAPFPSCLVVFTPGQHGFPFFTTMDRILDTEVPVGL